MATRMLCTDCATTARPSSRIGGSDGLELLGWALGALPGWLYCAWRNALAVKLCPFCGGAALLRETRASAAHGAALYASAPRILDGTGGPWPEAWRDPRARLRLGAGWLAAWALAAVGAPVAGAILGLGWLGWQAALPSSTTVAASRCQAWDSEGRTVAIEFA